VILPLVPVIVIEYVPGVTELPTVSESKDDPEPLTDVGLKVTVTPEGTLLALRLTVDANPLKLATLTFQLVLLFCKTKSRGELIPIEKSALFPTARLAVAVLTSDAPQGPVLHVPVIVKFVVPVATPFVVTVNVVWPGPLDMEVGLNVPTAPDGRPLTENVT